MEAIVTTAIPLIEAEGIFLPYCSEAQIDSAVSISLLQKNALKCERNRLLARQNTGEFNMGLIYVVECFIANLYFMWPSASSPTVISSPTRHSYISFFRCMLKYITVKSFNTSPAIDTWSYHVMHHLSLIHGRVM